MSEVYHGDCRIEINGLREELVAADELIDRQSQQIAVLTEQVHILRDNGCNSDAVYFYEREFYVLSNFSAFSLEWDGKLFPTSEHAYHYERFPRHGSYMQKLEIVEARSAHDAFRYAQENKEWQWDDWDARKVDIMRDILRAKAAQHEYVHRKLLETGERTLIENSWRDDFWGWGANGNGQNMLGKLWMDVREEARTALKQSPTARVEKTADEKRLQWLHDDIQDIYG